MRLPLFLFTALGLFLSSCGGDEIVYEEIHDLDESTWSYGDQYDFSFAVEDTSAVYRLLFYLEFSTDYQWQNIYTTIETAFPNDSLTSEVVSFELAANTGRWYGSCDADLCRLNIPLQEEVRFPAPGDYRISFEQYMRQPVVRGIAAVGLKLVIPALD